MPLTVVQKRIVNRAIGMWAKDQQTAGNETWLVDIATATEAQVRAALAPYVQTIRQELVTREQGLRASRAAEDAAITQEKADIDSVLSIL